MYDSSYRTRGFCERVWSTGRCPSFASQNMRYSWVKWCQEYNEAAYVRSRSSVLRALADVPFYCQSTGTRLVKSSRPHAPRRTKVRWCSKGSTNQIMPSFIHCSKVVERPWPAVDTTSTSPLRACNDNSFEDFIERVVGR